MTCYLDLIFEINNFIKRGKANNRTLKAIKNSDLKLLLELGYSNLELWRIFENNFLVTGVYSGVVKRNKLIIVI